MGTLITSGTGFIGAEVARTLLQGDISDVMAFDVSDSLQRSNDVADQHTVLKGDLADFGRVSDAFGQVRRRLSTTSVPGYRCLPKTIPQRHFMEIPNKMELKRSSLREQVREIILAKVASGDLQPGDRIVEARLVEELRTSNIPVREAIRELVAERVLESAPHKGAWVRKPSIDEAIEAFAVRAILDAGAARMAVNQLRGRSEHLREAAEGTAEAAAANDFNAFARHNRALHRGIVEATRNSCLLRTWDSANIEVHGLLAMGSLELVDREALVNDHMAIVDALHRGDGEKAASLLSLHARRMVECLSHAREREQQTQVSSPQS
jgi:DNA-binding GntR family transcriptional regulator